MSEFVGEFGFFDGHVLKFARLEDFAAFKAFHKFSVFFASNDLDTRVLTWRHVVFHSEVRSGGSMFHISGGYQLRLLG